MILIEIEFISVFDIELYSKCDLIRGVCYALYLPIKALPD